MIVIPTVTGKFPVNSRDSKRLTLMEEWRGWCATFTIWAITAHPTSQFIRTAHKSQLGIF